MEASRPDVRSVILDAAEQVFGTHGFDGTSMKAVAEKAAVAQSLLSYHFGNKEGLYVAMFERHSSAMNQIRYSALDELAARGRPPVEDVLDALLRPTVKLGRGNTGGFSRLLMREVISADERSKGLIGDAFDQFATRCIEVLRLSLPELSKRDAVWGYLFSLSVAMTMMAPTGRSLRLSDGVCDDADLEALLHEAVTFAAAGLRAFAARSGTTGTSSSKRISARRK